MPSLPHIVYGTCTKADSSAYTGKVWLTNETTNQTVNTECNSSGQYVYDLANMDSYANGDELTIALEAYGNPGFVLTNRPFDDTSVETVEFDGQRLNTATLTMNFKITSGVSRDKARVEVFRKIYNQLNADKPSYTDRDSVIKTYTIVSAFPEVTPTFPCIVVNPIVKDTVKLGVDKRPNTSLPSEIDIDFFAKTRDGKNAVDSAKDKVEMILMKNWITEEITIDTSTGGQEQDITGVE